MDQLVRSPRIDALLAPGETLRWSGSPAQGLRFTAADAIRVPFSLLWGGFAIVWESLVIVHGPIFFRIWGIPFVLVGLYLIAGRFYVDAYRRAHTVYGVSDRAVYISIDGYFPKTLVFTANALATIEVKRESADVGSLTFGRNPGMVSNYGWNVWQSSAPQFAGIADIDRVYALVRDIEP